MPVTIFARSPESSTVRKKRGRTDAIDPSLRRLLDGYLHTPAFVLNPALDLLAVNSIARALFTPFEGSANIAHMTFLDRAAEHFFYDWTRSAENVVASLRHATGTHAKLLRLHEVIDDLRRQPLFEDFCSRSQVSEKTSGRNRLIHPEVGELDVLFHTFDVRGAEGQQLVVNSAPEGSSTSGRLMLLGTLHADNRQF